MMIHRSMLAALSGVRALIGRLMTAYLASGESGSFYVNGADVLPPPLSPAEEAETIARLGTDEAAVSTLIEHNLRLVVYIARKFENTGIGIEDLISIGTIGLIKAVRTYQADKNIKLATYASRCIENEILMHIRKTTQLRGEVSIDEPLHTDRDGNELLLSDVIGAGEDEVGRELERGEEERTIRAAVAALSPRERQIIELRYGMTDGEEHTQKDVAEQLGISQSYISRLEKKIILRLREKIGSKI